MKRTLQEFIVFASLAFALALNIGVAVIRAYYGV
jgi:hypothetical protein